MIQQYTEERFFQALDLNITLEKQVKILKFQT